MTVNHAPVTDIDLAAKLDAVLDRLAQVESKSICW
jgi:hypothetical protein